DKEVTLKAEGKPLRQLLVEAGHQAGFSFSYASHVISEDSLISISVVDLSIRDLLDRLLPPDIEYVESGDYLILRIPEQGLSMILEDIREQGNSYLVSGTVVDLRTGAGLPDASVYEKQLLLASLSDDNGQFLLRVRNRYKTVGLTASKIGYSDTTMFIRL